MRYNVFVVAATLRSKSHENSKTGVRTSTESHPIATQPPPPTGSAARSVAHLHVRFKIIQNYSLSYFLSLNYILNVTCSGAGGSSPEGRRSQVRTHQRVQDTLNDFMHDPSLRPLNIAAASDDPDTFMHSSATAYQPSMMSQRPAQQNRRKPQWVSKTPSISCRIRLLFTIYFRTVRPRNLHNADPNDRNPKHSNGVQQVNKYFF